MKYSHKVAPTRDATPNSLHDDMTANSCEPSENITNQLAGGITRFHVKGDNPSKLNGWIMQLGECLIYGSWRIGSKHLWWPDGGSRDLSSEERAKLDRQIEASKIEREQANVKAAHDAKTRMAAVQPASADHPYLVAKNIQPDGMKQEGGTLLVPMFNVDGAITGLQEIYPNGRKWFPKGTAKKGNFWCVGDSSVRLYLGEGVATMAAVRRDTGGTVIATMDAGNLPIVAALVRKKFPDSVMIICADDDEVGHKCAKRAQKLTGAVIALPKVTL